MSPDAPPGLDAAKVPPHVLEVVAALRAAGFEAFLVGGCVRDMLLGRPPKDFDVATSALPPDVQKRFRKVIPTGIEHGTVTVVTKGHPVEVTTFRSEGDYLDGRRPSSVQFRSEVEEDLSRRDFTINAMAFDPTQGRLVDPFGGRDDLKAKTVRCVGEAMARFSEDGLRPLRAVRLSAQLGFTLDAATGAAIPATLHVFRKVAVERVRDELDKLLLSPRPAEGVRLLRSTGLLAVAVPEVPEAGAAFDETLEVLARAPAKLEVRLASLLLHVSPGQVPGVLARLKYSNKEQALTWNLLRHLTWPGGAEATDPEVRRLFAQVGADHADEFLAFTLARWPEAGRRFEANARRVLAAQPPLSTKALALKGEEIMTLLGVGPSPIVGEATRHLLEVVIEDPLENTRDRLAERLRAWAKAKIQ